MRSLIEVLNSQFDSLRYESVGAHSVLKFHEPVYWSDLLRSQPAILLGARGTGKTTALRAMDYNSLRSSGDAPADLQYIGVYWKFSTAVMHAFSGNGVSDPEWVKVFQYYVNLVLVDRLLDVLAKVEVDRGAIGLLDDRRLWQRLARLLSLTEGRDLSSYSSVRNQIEDRIDTIQIWINSPQTARPALGAPAGSPIELIVDCLWNSERLSNVPVYFLLDEFENLLDYQQKVFNTLLKHSGDSHYTFKIGVRPNGRRITTTLNEDEIVSDPADYELIDIERRMAEEDGRVFESFAYSVCCERLGLLEHGLLDLHSLFPALSWEDEAEKFGDLVPKKAKMLRNQLLAEGRGRKFSDYLSKLSDAKLCFISDWVKSHEGYGDLGDAVVECVDTKPGEWVNRINNYATAWLFTLEKKGVRIRKFYCGWSALCKIAGNNIRYLLDIVRSALAMHEREEGTLADPVSCEHQTLAVHSIGDLALEQLAYASQYGPRLRWLALGIGTLFGNLAADGLRHAPEVGSFGLKGSEGLLDSDKKLVEDLLKEAAVHQLFILEARNKRAKLSTLTTDTVYRMHPIFCARFLFSYRSKRLMELKYSDLIRLSANESGSVRDVIQRCAKGGNSGGYDGALF